VIAAPRDSLRLLASFVGETRIGDLSDPAHRREVVRDADVVIHAGAWSSFWGHEREELELFEVPAVDLIDQAVSAGVGHFIGAGDSLRLVSTLIPRLKTRSVPWVNHGRVSRRAARTGLRMARTRTGVALTGLTFAGRRPRGPEPAPCSRRARAGPLFAAGPSRPLVRGGTDGGSGPPYLQPGERLDVLVEL